MTIVSLLAEARRQDYSFEDAWEMVFAGGGRTVLTNDRRAASPLSLVWPTDPPTRRESQLAILSCKAAFERAYKREPPTPGDRAALILPELLASVPDDPTPRQPPWSLTAHGRPARGRKAS